VTILKVPGWHRGIRCDDFFADELVEFLNSWWLLLAKASLSNKQPRLLFSFAAPSDSERFFATVAGHWHAELAAPISLDRFTLTLRTTIV
jgi:hypothetical protein